MIDRKFLMIAIILSIATILTFSFSTFGQPPPKGGMVWFDLTDTNKNGQIETEEYRTAIDLFFKKLDSNADGVIDREERPPRPLPPKPGGEGDFRPKPFPFFVMESIRQTDEVSRSVFEENTTRQFKLMDKNGDGVISRLEARARFEEINRLRNELKPRDFQPFDSPTAKFIGAEIRFGEKQVKDAPFSAETVIENTRRLFDGSTVTQQNKGAIYRDGAGRTRREQPLQTIGGFDIVGENNQPQKLIFINDFIGKTHYFIDLNRKVAQKRPLPDNRPPLPAEMESKDGKTESLGTKMLEGVSVEGTRTTIEIPVGQIGNDKPMQIVTEKWYSPDLQVIVMSRHLDPLAGEHIFRLVNIKRGEPSPDLFTVPTGFRIVNPPQR